MRLGIDIDGVLARFEGSYNDLLIKYEGKDLRPHPDYQPLEWNWDKALGYSGWVVEKAWNEIKSSESFWATLPAYGETVGILARLKEMKFSHDIYFITHRMGVNPKWQTERWLEHHGYSKPTVLVSGDKGHIAFGLHLDAIIDDKPSNCEEVVRHCGIDCQAWLLDRPWNSTYEHKYINRVNSVHEWLDYCLNSHQLEVSK